MRSLMCTNPAKYFLDSAAAWADYAALRVSGAEISYRELAARAGRIAAWILDVKDRPDARIGLLAKRSPEAYAGALGACMAGAAYVPVDPDLPLERQLVMLKRADLTAIVTDRQLLHPLIAEQIGVKVLGPREIKALTSLPLDEAQPVALDAPAYLMFTSGSTGSPKPVVVTMGNLAHFLEVMRRRCPLYPDDRVSQFYEMGFDVSVFDLFHGLSGGSCLFVVPPAERMAPAKFIRENFLTIWSSVPSVIGFMDRLKLLPKGAFPTLRYSMFCGEPLLASCAEAFRRAAPNSTIDNQYGPTETTINCFGEWVTDPPRVTSSRGVVSIGKPFPDMVAAIVDTDGMFLPQGHKGEIAVSGPQIAAGYFGEPELTRRRFRMLEHPVLGRALFYLTGDIGYQDADGHFHHLGRTDHQVKILGRRVEIEEIESHIREASGGEALVVAWPVRDGSAQGVIAFVAGGEWTPAGLSEALKQRLPSYMVPRQIIRRDSLPTSANGKLSRTFLIRELEQMASAVAP